MHEHSSHAYWKVVESLGIYSFNFKRPWKVHEKIWSLKVMELHAVGRYIMIYFKFT